MSDLVLDVSNLRVEFPLQGKPNKVAVDDVSFQLKKGEILGIVGESGSGKSVTSLAIMGLIQTPGKIADGSRIKYYQSSEDYIELTQLESSQWTKYRGKEIAMIFQEPMSAFNPVYTIGYQLTEAIKLHQNVTQDEANIEAIKLLKNVKVLKQTCPNQQATAYLKRYPHELSGGQLQRVMIAMAISCNPQILIADEPTTALDVTVQKGILELLRGLCKDNNIAMIFISHDLGVINEVADDILVMRNGKVLEEGKKEQILRHPQDGYTKGLLACRPPLHIRVEKLPTVADFLEDKKDTDLSKESDLIYTIIPHDEIEARTKEAEEKKVLLSVEKLTVEFGKSAFFGLKSDKFKAVNNISFKVHAGETLGLVGESGCGKSTLARTILRLIPAADGNVSFETYEISKKSMSNKWLRNLRKNMQIVFQNPYNSLNPRLTVGQAIAEPMIIHKTQSDSKKRREIVNALLSLVGLEIDTYNRYPHEFSGGQRQRVCIARALALNPRFLICDESVSALDVSVQAQVLNLLKDLQQKLKLTCIFISHDFSVVRFMSDRIMVMNQGEVVEIGEAENIINNPQEDYTKNLLNSIPKFPEDLKWTPVDIVTNDH
ncbi:MAG: ABC transporter ATP-binding protein [Crocosphaera sp.]|nr:ABC transporter ATP-binding protein [Crocosphaera sp.]